jgi:hypothetical protein
MTSDEKVTGILKELYQELFHEVYSCDFCLKYFTENRLDRCDNCGEIFCKNCVTYDVTKQCNKYLHSKHHFCSETCCDEYTICLPNQCNIHHTARNAPLPTPFLDGVDSVNQ